MSDIHAIKVAVVYEGALLAEGLRSTLCRAGLEVVEPGAQPDVVVADYASALSLLAPAPPGAAQHRSAGSAVVILSQRAGSGEIRHAMQAGALGYLTADCSLEESIAAVRSVHKGTRYLCVVAAARLAESIHCELLTARELEVLHLIAEGHANKGIARELDISVGTVKSHVKAILHKLDAGSRTRAAAVAEHRGLLKLPAAHFGTKSAPPYHRSLPADRRGVAALR